MGADCIRQLKAEAFSLEGAWVPFYNLHKTFAGLRDAWLLTRDAQAREVLVGFADWADRLVAGLDDAQLQRILDTEHGGMNEVLADVYAITGDRRYLALARRFSHRALLDPLLRGEDRLDGLHANTQIPKVIGFARIGELDGDEAWIEAARFFWERVALHRSIAFGGNSVREHFNPAGDFAPMVQSREGPETCNSYNMLKLTLLLDRLRPDPRHADFYERTLFNHILSTQHPGHGGLVYFTPIRPRHYRVYSQPQECFWCCVGSGMENHGRHAAFAYAHDDRALRVNLYMDSQLHWAARGLVLHQQTRFPEEPRSELRLALERPQAFALELRHPHWLHGPLQVKVNGRPWPLRSTPSSYARIERRWKDGDRVEVELPMHTRIEALPDGSDWVAVMHGPLMLAARSGEEDLDGLLADAGRGSHIAPGPYLPLDRAPMLVGERDALTQGIEPVPGEPLVFSAAALVRPGRFRELRLEPLHRIHDARYMAYWRTATPGQYPAVVASIEAAERERQAVGGAHAGPGCSRANSSRKSTTPMRARIHRPACSSAAAGVTPAAAFPIACWPLQMTPGHASRTAADPVRRRLAGGHGRGGRRRPARNGPPGRLGRGRLRHPRDRAAADVGHGCARGRRYPGAHARPRRSPHRPPVRTAPGEAAAGRARLGHRPIRPARDDATAMQIALDTLPLPRSDGRQQAGGTGEVPHTGRDCTRRAGAGTTRRADRARSVRSSRNACLQAAEFGGARGGLQRRVVHIALHDVAAQCIEQPHMGCRFDAFGDELLVQRLGQGQ